MSLPCPTIAALSSPAQKPCQPRPGDCADRLRRSGLVRANKGIDLNKDRLAAFSDGVLAIIITIMVLELKVPHGADWAALSALLPIFLSYTLSFIYVAIYWNNHHHLLHTVKHVNGAILWANNNLLFWLSLVPFATAWAGETHFAREPTILYGFALLMPAISFTILTTAIVRTHPNEPTLAKALGRDAKGKVSMALYIGGIALAFVHPSVAYTCYGLVALIWLVPDRRIERELKHE